MVAKLYATNSILGNVADSVASIIGVPATMDASGNIKTTNIGNTGKNTIHEAIIAAKTEVVGGTNIVNVTSKTDSTDSHTTYTINAKGTTASAGSDAVIVTQTTDATTNITDYKVDLSDDTKATLDQVDTNKNNIATNADNITTLQQEFNINTGATGTGTGTVTGNVSTAVLAGNTVTYTAGNNIAIIQDGQNIIFATSMNPIFTSVTGDTATFGGNTTINGDGITIKAPTGSTSGDVVLSNTGLNNGGNKITNVAAGTVGANSTSSKW